jgi:hypothetical protein
MVEFDILSLSAEVAEDQEVRIFALFRVAPL